MRNCSNSGEYANATLHQCVKCHDFCKECSGGSATSCSSCNVGYFLIKEKSECSTSCPSGFYKVGTECKKC